GPVACRQARRQGRSQGERIGLIIVAAVRMVDHRLAARPRPALQGCQLAAELRVVQEDNLALGEERFDFQVCQALVEVARRIRIPRDLCRRRSYKIWTPVSVTPTAYVS